MLSKDNLIWIDLEMTGLNPNRDRIIEIAVLITDMYLNMLTEGLAFVIYQSDEQLSLMDEWNFRTHTASGLIDDVRKSKLNEMSVASLILGFLKQYVPIGVSPMCGSSLVKDRFFLFNYMPELESYFHYRCIDVSSIKELVCRWSPDISFKYRINKKKHRALDDICRSVQELLYYRKYFINFL